MAFFNLRSSLFSLALRCSVRRIVSSASSNLSEFSNSRETMLHNSPDQVTRVLFCGLEFPYSQEYTKEYLKDVPYIQVDALPLTDVPKFIHNYHACVVKMFHLDSDNIKKAVQLKLILQFGVGLEGVDIKAATRNKIKVGRIPGSETGNSASCAEMAIYLMMGLLRKQKEMENAVKTKKLGEPIGEMLLGKKVFIMGFGAIGVDLAKRLRPFGVKIFATKRSWNSNSLQLNGDTTDDLVDEKGTAKDNLKFAAEVDIVATCLTLSDETKGIVNKKFLSAMRKGSLLVNVARGGLLDYKAVYEHLESGHLGGLGIDVAWQEPFNPEDKILKFQNVLMTPHVAGVTEISYRTMAKIVGECLKQFHDGKEEYDGIEIVNKDETKKPS